MYLECDKVHFFRLFFRKDTGYCVHKYYVNDMYNNGTRATVEQDLQALSALKDYNSDFLTAIDVEDLETIEKINTCTSVKLNDNKLVFDFTPEQIEEVEKKKTLEEEVKTLKEQLLEVQNYVVEQKYNNLLENGGV